MSIAVEQIGVLVACHNRRQQSVSAISELLLQAEGVFDLRVFVYDAASTDGTGEALSALGSRVHLIAGTDENYWASSMRIAATEAESWAPDWFMLLNDDIDLAPGVMKSFEREIRPLGAEARRSSVYVGDVRDPATDKLVYGARTQSADDPFNFFVDQDRTAPVHTCNGNFVLIGKNAYVLAGGFPAGFTHGYADYVLGLRLRKAGIQLKRLPKIAGEGSHDTPWGGDKDRNRSLIERLRIVFSPFGMPPREQWSYCVEVAGVKGAPGNMLRSYRRVFFPDRAPSLE